MRIKSMMKGMLAVVMAMSMAACSGGFRPDMKGRYLTRMQTVYRHGFFLPMKAMFTIPVWCVPKISDAMYEFWVGSLPVSRWMP